MTSDICKLNGGTKALSKLLDETEKAAGYSNLDKQQTNRLRLLAEELVEMLPELLAFSEGEFWVQSEGKNFELHTRLTPNKAMTADRREKLLAVSTSGKNAAATGIMSKIRLAAEFMLIDYGESAEYSPAFYEFGMGVSIPSYTTAWTLDSYRANAGKQKGDTWDELERSIIANLADDVVVGVKGTLVEIIVKKSF